MSDIARTLAELEAAAPKLYSRWSAKAWRLACAGPATRLWDALDKREGASALEDYLFLLREAIGMQYITATRAEDLEPGAPGHGYFAEMFCQTLPRLLPSAETKTRGAVLASVWNVGEKLVGKPVWLDRYLAARLPELASLDGFEAFLARVVGEGMDGGTESTWSGPISTSQLDLAPIDRAFLPGDMHLATPSVLCVHDRRRAGRHIAVLLRDKALSLGVTPCLGRDGDAAKGSPGGFLAKAIQAAEIPDIRSSIATRSGRIAMSTSLSQRLWIVASGK